jgi:anionic cell wall polymer biosynthesis LytR-Cps2A-Psr (LCP) family protein
VDIFEVLVKEIDSSRNLERLSEVNQKIGEITKDNHEIEMTIPNLSQSLDLLEKHTYVTILLSVLK